MVNYNRCIDTILDRYLFSNQLYRSYYNRQRYEVRDSVVNGRFDSSDMYGRLEKGHTYKVTVIGFRIPMLSWYKNILTAEEIEGQ